MPKGKKFTNGYCSISGIPSAKNYRQISSICGNNGMKIGPSNVRNVLLSAMKKIAKPVCDANSIVMSDDEIMAIAKNPHFQLSVASLLKEEIE
jgi:hypothetical protein